MEITNRLPKGMGPKRKSGLMRRIQQQWDACEDIRLVDGKWQLAVRTVMGGLHWIWIDVAPTNVAAILGTDDDFRCCESKNFK